MPKQRDLRIDFFRGLALYTILVDHIGNNPLSGFTYQRFGYSDAAEAFVFLSGVSCGLAFPVLLAQRGARELLATLAGRTAKLYGYYVVSSIALIALIYAAADPLMRAGALTPLWSDFAHQPLASMGEAILLRGQPTLPAILVLYMVLTLVVVPVFLLCARRGHFAALLISAAVWLSAQVGLFGLDQPGHLFLFNPLAWQFLFCIGMSCGLASRRGVGPLSSGLASALVAAAWAIIVISLLLRALPWLGAGRLALDEYHKYNLSAVRLVHFLSVATVISAHVGPVDSMLRVGREFIIKTGRWSLEIFSVGTFLSELGTVLFATTPLPLWEQVAFNALAILATALLAVLLAERKGRGRVSDAASSRPSA